jgi:1,5-anhydro-D-fructose reductase (1,5-anhydro-D-mannitol-forming)
MESTMLSRLALLPLLLNLMGVILSVNSMNMNLPASTGSTGTIPTAPSSSGKVVRWGIIGLGDVVKHQTGPAFLQAEDSELVAVCGSRTPGKAASWAAENGGPNCRGYNHLEDFLADDRIDAYYIATPPGQHVFMAMKVATVAADNGAAVYIEKPVGRSYEETATISASLQARNIPLYTAYTSRAYPRTVAVKELLESGRIGKVVNITYRLSGLDASTGTMENGMVQDGGLAEQQEQSKSLLPWRLQADVSGGGLFVDVGCHLLDRLDFIAGPLLDVRGQGLNRQSPGQDVEDYVWMKARIGSESESESDSDSENDEQPKFCAGADVDCIWDFTPPDGSSSDNNDQLLTDELIFHGTKGSLQMKGMSPDAPVRVLHEDGSLVEELVFESTSLAAGSGSLPLIQTITNELLGKGQGEGEQDGQGQGQCQSKSFNAMRTSAVMDTILKEYYGGRGDDFFHRPESWPGIPPSRRELYLDELRSQS